jgi:hypothetical protein
VIPRSAHGLPMQLKAVVSQSLPQLAWVAEVNRRSGLITLVHGRKVEVRPNFFIEGVWNGSFADGDFGETDCVFGSGAILNDQSIRFVPSASTVDSLHYAESGAGVITVSNSLPLLLASTGDALNPHCPDYPIICDSVMDGIDDYRRNIPTRRGMVQRQIYRNLEVSRDNIAQLDKRMPSHFTCFKDYREYIQNNYKLIAANARDSSRIEPLEIWSTQSRGYDTTAINAMVRAYGIDKVFTVTRAKNKFYLAHNDEDMLPDDDGSEICKVLDLNCIQINRSAFRKEFNDEYLYYCARHHNQDVNLKEISKHISKVGVLLTGVHGEILCANDPFVLPPLLDSTMRRLDVGGHGLGEFRLVAGFIHAPVPFIGARRKEDIVKITESSEMDRWCLGNTYDRPIARRIAEEAGIPRWMFGQSKMGSVVIFHRPAVPYGKALRKQFFDYLVAEQILSKTQSSLWPIIRQVNSILMLKSEKRFPLVHYAERVITKLAGREFQFKLLWSHLDGALFCFCVNRTAQKYSHLLSRSKDMPPETLANMPEPLPTASTQLCN